MKKLFLFLAALLTATVMNLQAADPVSYLYPEYNTFGDPTSGIKEWKTGSCTDYMVVADVEEEPEEGVINWGEDEQDTWYVVNGEITLSYPVYCNGQVHLILTDGAKLTVNGTGDRAGITIDNSDYSLTIYGQSAQTGQLFATGGDDGGAGIGGDSGKNITINGCEITATGGSGGAGIGGGWGGSGSDITINGGTVTATGNFLGAGIGGGMGGSGSDITINGGEVTATGGENAGAGIGGGQNASGSNITINGGTVIATGVFASAGIGGGQNASSSDITINGGTVTAIGLGGAGIGGGQKGSGSNITINGGTVTANSISGAGIGSGFEGSAASNIFVDPSLILKADNNNPPTTVIAPTRTATTDVASDLAGTQYTTVTAPLDPVMSFDADTVNKDIMDDPFINPLTTTAGVGDTTYTSSDTTVAIVDANGQVTILAGGTTTITASVAETATYAAKSVSYVLNVTYTPQEGTFWKETFSKVPAVNNFSGSDKYVGDSSVYKWVMTYYQRQTTKTGDSVGNYLGTRIRYYGSLAMDSVQEGGIKAVRFDYRAANQINPIHFIVKVDGVDYDYKHAAIPVRGTIITYAKKFEVKKNVQFSINVNAQESPVQTYPIISPITITPYLLYTTKSAEATDKYTNTDLINNTPDTATIVYTLEDNDDEASINASTGEVTCLAEGEVTVRATWGQVSTTYTLTTHITPVAETYGRKLEVSGSYGTICLAKKFTSTEGVEGLYVPATKDATTLYCEEVSVSDVVAGGAYIFKANADSVTFVLDGEAVSAAVNNDNMMGWLAADSTLTEESDYYDLNGNTIIKLAAGSTIKQNCAVIDLDNVSTGTPDPGRKYVSFVINSTPTGVVDINTNVNANRKVMVNGQLIILRDGKMYDAQGTRL